jgi:hypothetical protein
MSLCDRDRADLFPDGGARGSPDCCTAADYTCQPIIVPCRIGVDQRLLSRIADQPGVGCNLRPALCQYPAGLGIIEINTPINDIGTGRLCLGLVWRSNVGSPDICVQPEWTSGGRRSALRLYQKGHSGDHSPELII